MQNFTPLNSTFMAASIIGLLVSILYVPTIANWKDSETWSFAFSIIFFAMLIASLLSMTRAPATPQVREYVIKKIKKKKYSKKH